MRFKKTLLSLLCAPFAFQMACAEEALSHLYTPTLTDETAPWFTGPLLAPSVHTIPQGHVDLEPYLFFYAFNGSYDKSWHSKSSDHNFYNLQLLIPGWVGITPYLDFTIQLQAFYQFTQGERSVQFGDIPFGFDFQLLNEQPGTWWPAIKLGLKASIPTGKYQNLNANKLGTDAAGAGNWLPTVVLALGRLFAVTNNHFVSPRLVFTYTVPNPFHVHNLNSFGGTDGTSGTVYQGNIFSADLGIEYNITRNWAFACDLYYQHNNKNRFSGNTGFIEPGIPAVMTRPSSEGFSLAPAIEYNWSANIGIIGGVWFTMAGRNTARFVNGTVAFNVYI